MHEISRYNSIMDEKTELVKYIGKRLKEKGLYLATAESCTGGLLGHMITNLSGSSDFYLGGQITYSNMAKIMWLGVPKTILDMYGAVSEETVLSMASGIRQAFSHSANIEKVVGISISGIAGPTGGTVQKPVGTVWIGVSIGKNNKAYLCNFAGNREAIKIQSAQRALEIILENIP